MKNTVYLIGNAHLDPVWMWRWQEGSAEAKATVRSALDRMNEFPDFKFVCSSASVYRWIEDFDPDMFAEIKRRVAEGRFIVVGGWHVQPDCNLPGGEGFARQGLYSQRYFQEKLGVRATVGYNVDSFGHNLMLPQILVKSGMDSYVFMRPGEHERHLDSNLFRWRSPDGSEVLCCRIADNYCFRFDTAEHMRERAEQVSGLMPEGIDCAMLFYGVGNHGGGPTIRNIEAIKECAAVDTQTDYVFAGPADFFDHVRAISPELPVREDDLQHHASGCYSAVSEIKTLVRQSETALVAAECYSVLAEVMLGRKYPTDLLRRAWLNTLFCHFHDCMGGCSIKDVYDDARIMEGEALNIAAQTENSALQSISWAADTSDSSKGIPVFVFNPHAWRVKTPVTINRQVSRITDTDGNPVVCQHVYSQAQSCMCRDDTLFTAELPALGYRVYYIVDAAPAPADKCVSAEGLVLENSCLRVEFEGESGYIKSITDKHRGTELLRGYGAVPVVIDESAHDTWSHGKNFFTAEIARFTDAVISVTEDGPLRASIKVVSRYNNSYVTQYFKLYDGSDTLEVSVTADWREKHKMLKLAYEFAVDAPRAFYELPFGVIERPCNGEEEPGQMWTAVRGDNFGVAILNRAKYSSSVNADGTLLLTALRSPIYGDHGGPRTEESMFTGQGFESFEYAVSPLCGNTWAPTVRAARQLNTPPTVIIENNHRGRLPLTAEALRCSPDNITVSAFKRSEDGSGLVLRAYETDGKHTHAVIELPLHNTSLEAEFAPFSVNTYLLDGQSGEWREVLMTEFDK